MWRGGDRGGLPSGPPNAGQLSKIIRHFSLQSLTQLAHSLVIIRAKILFISYSSVVI